MAPLDKISPEDIPGDQDFLTRASVIHDVNQMLAVITGRAELMLHRGRDGLSQDDLKTIVLAATDAAEIMRRLTGESPGAPRGPVTCSLETEVRNAGLLVRPPEGKPWAEPGLDEPSRGRVLDIRVDSDLAAALPGQVVREVLTNLFLNALEAMPGTGGIVVSAERRGDRVALEVADEGPGLDTDAVERIFQPGATSHDQPGRGMGLPGCRQLLAGFGASLDFVDGKGPGAVFRLDLPWTAAAPVGRDGADSPARDDGPPVLVVDDEPGVRGMLIDLLGEMGCPASAARDVKGALDAFAPGRYAVVLLDQSLPDGTGRELAMKMRVLDPFVTIVLMTGLDRAAEIEVTDSDQVDLAAVKPLTWDTIGRLVDQGAALHERRRKAGDS